MRRPAREIMRFVRALTTAEAAVCLGELYEVAAGKGTVSLPGRLVRELQSHGILGGDEQRCVATPLTRQWLKRQMLDEDAFAAQHRTMGATSEGTPLNLAESPLSRLATAAAGEAAFLERHQVEAGERVRRLVERARLQPRLTMSYSGVQRAGKGMQRQEGEISDLAADARKGLAALYEVLPRDCADVVVDVCGLEKGLQQIESERGWPRRSAKLVLRIGLDRLAEHYGLGSVAVGAETRRRRAWMEGERPAMFE